MPESDPASVVPAQLGFLAIYNPLLGPTDETLQDQVVFYTSRSDQLKRREGPAVTDEAKDTNNEWNERLRQIGLAQGMVSFARNFSEGKAIDYVETDKSHIVLRELEENWWILASVDLTRLPIDASSTTSTQSDASDGPKHNYSSREMCPPSLLIQHLCRAHSTFLLHHDFSLDAMYGRLGRPTFCTLLDNFWRRFAWNWEVLLNGNPAVDMYNGIKLSAGGELGIGVGEEEWGSGEREVLEDFVARTDGLLDLVVSRFGDPSPQGQEKPGDLAHQWLGLDIYPRPSDGVIFSGVGAISRPSVVNISQWMEWIYKYGIEAYGVGEDPTSPRRRKRRRRRGRSGKDTDPSAPTDGTQVTNPDRGFSPGIPRPLVIPTADSSQPPQGSDGLGGSVKSDESSPSRSERGSEWTRFRTDTFVKYLTLGYGSSWGTSSESPSPHPRVEALKQEDATSGANTQETSSDTEPTNDKNTPPTKLVIPPKNHGKFLIGLLDDTTNPDGPSVDEPVVTESTTGEPNEVISQRLLHVHRSQLDQESSDLAQVRAVVYIHQPFMYTFLFDPNTPSLADPSLYHTIHHQLGPLQKPLNNSTSPVNAAARISLSEKPLDIDQRFPAKNQPVYDLVYDPSNLTIRSSIPNIPDLAAVALAQQQHHHQHQQHDIHPPWSRVESLNIHHRLLSTYVETRARPLELERTCKTSRGWWIVWVRMSDPSVSSDTGIGIGTGTGTGTGTGPTTPATSDTDLAGGKTNQSMESEDARQEAFIIRKASDHVSPASHARNSSGTQFFRDLGGAGFGSSSARNDTGPGKLVEGLGLDARRYIENLLSLNR